MINCFNILRDVKMKVLIAGSGIIGVSSAYYLAKAGHDVTVIDRQASAALETSYANAGQLSYGMSSPWAAPGIPFKAIKWIISEYAPLIINPKLGWQTLKFLGRLLRNCTSDRYAINKSRMVRISSYSKQAIAEFIQEHNFDFELRNNGLLQVFRTDAQLKGCAKDMKVLDQFGVKYELLNAEQCIDAEPGLRHVKDQIKGGLRYLDDQSANCFLFTNHLVEECMKLGVQFDYDVTINSIAAKDKNINGINTSQGLYTADKYIIALGSFSTQLLKPLGIYLPIYPVKGYSITLPVKADEDAPQGTLMDESYKVAITRLGDKVRVAGIAELTSFDNSLSYKGKKTTQYVINDLFPKAVKETDDIKLWTGFRPMTPDGTPIIGNTDYANLFLNTGHGTLGWTMGLGSGKLIKSIVCGEKTDIDTEGLAVSRYA